MPAPAYRRVWQSPSFLNYDIPATTGIDYTRRQIWILKAFLKGEIGPGGAGVWSHVASCDGVSMSTTTDLWGAVYDGSKIVRGPTYAARSWIVLRGPAAGINGVRPYLFIDFCTSSDFRASFAFSTAYAGPVSVADPGMNANGTDAWGSYTADGAAGVWFDLQINGAVANMPASRMHGNLADNGSFWCALTENANASMRWGIVSLGYRSDAVFWAPYEAQPFFTGVMKYGQAWLGVTSVGSSSFSEYAVTSPGTGGCCGREPTNVANVTALIRATLRVPILVPVVTVGAGITSIAATPVNSATADGVRGMIPAFVCNPNDPRVGGLRGVIEDVFIGVVNVPDGTLTPPTAQHLYVFMGGLWLPCSDQPIFG